MFPSWPWDALAVNDLCLQKFLRNPKVCHLRPPSFWLVDPPRCARDAKKIESSLHLLTVKWTAGDGVETDVWIVFSDNYKNVKTWTQAQVRHQTPAFGCPAVTLIYLIFSQRALRLNFSPGFVFNQCINKYTQGVPKNVIHTLAADNSVGFFFSSLHVEHIRVVDGT